MLPLIFALILQLILNRFSTHTMLINKIRNSINNIGSGGDATAAITNDENKENENNQQPPTSQAIIDTGDNQSLAKKLSLITIEPPKLSVPADDKSVDSNEGLESIPSCNITADTSRDYIENKLSEINGNLTTIKTTVLSTQDDVAILKDQMKDVRDSLRILVQASGPSHVKKSIEKENHLKKTINDANKTINDANKRIAELERSLLKKEKAATEKSVTTVRRQTRSSRRVVDNDNKLNEMVKGAEKSTKLKSKRDAAVEKRKAEAHRRGVVKL